MKVLDKYKSVFAKTFPVIRWSWLLLAAIVIGIVCLMHYPVESDWGWLLPLNGKHHFLMMLAGTAALTGLGWLCNKCFCRNTIRRNALLVVSGLLTIAQIFVISQYYFHTNWDVQQVTGAATALAEGQPVDDFKDYFRWNPNNLFLTRIFSLIFFVTGPLWGHSCSLLPLLVLQCMMSWISGLMLVQTAIHIWKQQQGNSQSAASIAIAVYLFYWLVTGTSPWWSIPYSDIWGLATIVTVTWLATAAPFKRQWLRIIIIATISIIGYSIKPQTLFISFSLAIVAIAQHLAKGHKFIHLAKPASFAASGILVGLLIVNLSMVGCPFNLHPSTALGASHYIMMGANYQSIGIYSAEDVDFSHSFHNKSERRREELKRAGGRYKAMGFSNTMLLWGRKILLNFSDGTFYWGREGNFYREIPDHSGPVASATRELYYTSGKYIDNWRVAMTSVWLGMILLAMLAAIPYKRRENNSNAIIHAIMLTVIMATLFHMICEARSRYLFCFTPMFVLLAVEGLRRIAIFGKKRA